MAKQQSRTPIMQSAMARNESEILQKRQFSQPDVPFQFQQLMVNNKNRLQRFEDNLQNVQSQIIIQNEHPGLVSAFDYQAAASPSENRIFSELGQKIARSASRNIITDKKGQSRMTSATGSSLPLITNQLGKQSKMNVSKHGRNKTMSESMPSVLQPSVLSAAQPQAVMPQSPWGRLQKSNLEITSIIQQSQERQ